MIFLVVIMAFIGQVHCVNANEQILIMNSRKNASGITGEINSVSYDALADGYFLGGWTTATIENKDRPFIAYKSSTNEWHNPHDFAWFYLYQLNDLYTYQSVWGTWLSQNTSPTVGDRVALAFKRFNN